VGERKPPEENSVDGGEDCGIRPDAERQSEDGDCGERALPGEKPECNANIPAQVVEQRPVTAGANAFLHLFDATKLDHCEAPRLTRGNTLPNLVRCSHLDERTNFVVEPAFGSIPVEDPRCHRHKTTVELHVPPARW
jgi:hypothetical protein